jgi:hypothetical protein
VTVYHERQKAPGSIRALGGMILFLGLAVIFLSLCSSHGERTLAIVTGVIGSLIGIAALAQSLSLRVDADSVRVTLFPFYVRTIPLQAIAEVSADVLRQSQYGGTGVRRVRGRPLAVFQSSGTAARLRLIDGQELLIQCADVDALSNAIRR